jgi:imidazolonepropionase
MMEGGVPVALGTDFNPNAHCMSMPTVMHMACVDMRLTMPEALSAATINAAASMGQADHYGSLQTGKWADILVVNAESWEHLIYQIPPPIDVYKKGKRVYPK